MATNRSTMKQVDTHTVIRTWPSTGGYTVGSGKAKRHGCYVAWRNEKRRMVKVQHIKHDDTRTPKRLVCTNLETGRDILQPESGIAHKLGDMLIYNVHPDSGRCIFHKKMGLVLRAETVTPQTNQVVVWRWEYSGGCEYKVLVGSNVQANWATTDLCSVVQATRKHANLQPKAQPKPQRCSDASKPAVDPEMLTSTADMHVIAEACSDGSATAQAASKALGGFTHEANVLESMLRAVGEGMVQAADSMRHKAICPGDVVQAAGNAINHGTLVQMCCMVRELQRRGAEFSTLYRLLHKELSAAPAGC